MSDDDPQDFLDEEEEDEDFEIFFFDGENYISQSELQFIYGALNFCVSEWTKTSETKKQIVLGDQVEETDLFIQELRLKADNIQEGFISLIEELYH